MANDKELLDRATRTFGTLAVTEAVAKVRAIIGLPSVPETETAAQAALDKLSKGRGGRPTAAELAALEFVIRMMRPAPCSRKGRLDELPTKAGSSVYQADTTTAWNHFREVSADILYSIGRLDRTSGNDTGLGTGFLICDNLLLTNHHVVSQLSHGADELDEGMAVVKFYLEVEGPEPVPECPVTRVVAIHDTLDLALLEVRVPDRRPALVLDTGTATVATRVATIGYPFKDERNPLFAEAIYQGDYGVKRGAIGELMARRGALVYHDCSTLGGNSGSPLLALDTARVIGVHFTGDFMYRNEAVSAAAVAQFVDRAARV